MSVSSAQGSEEIAYVPNWQIGESASYTLVKKKSNSENVFTAHFNIKVIAKDESGYILEWKYEDLGISPEPQTPEMQLMIDTICKITKELVIQYRTDKNGVFQEITNSNEVRSSITKAADIIIDVIPQAQVREKVKSIFQKQLQDDSFINNSVKEIKMLHTNIICGEKFLTGREYSAEVQMANLFDASVPFYGRIDIVTSHEENKNTYRITNTFDKEKSAQNISSIVEKLSGTKADKMLQLLQGMEITEKCVITVLDGEKWIEEYSAERTFTVPGKKVTETTLITINHKH